MKKIFFYLLSALAFVACSDDSMSFGNGENLVFTATIDNPQIRTSIARETGKVSWVEGDIILINGVEYVAHPDGENAATATFTKSDENAANPVKNGEGNYVATYGDVENQVYSPDGANCPMTATSGSTTLSFTNDCGVLRINANANGVEVSSVKVENYSLGCPGGVDITVAKDFYVALPAGTYNNLEIVFTGNGRNISAKVYNGDLTIERNHIYPITFSDELSFSAPVLPSEYTSISYIQSSGSQYINTGVIPAENTKVVLSDFCAINTADNWGVYLGATADDGDATTWWIRRDGERTGICSGIGKVKTSPYYNYHADYTFGTTISKLTLDNTGLYVNDVKAAGPQYQNTITPGSNPLYIFAGNSNGSPWRYSSMRIAACEIWEGSNKVRDYVAVKRNSDDAVGLYDFVSGNFFANQGSGVFTAGPVVPDPDAATTGSAPVLSSAGCPNNECGWVQLWENGPKWAVFNVGVTDGKAESLGRYFDGNSDTHVTTSWGSIWRMPTKSEFEELINPEKCNFSYTTVNGRRCLKITGKGSYSSNSLLFPAGGYIDYNQTSPSRNNEFGRYWTSTVSSLRWCMCFNDDNSAPFVSDGGKYFKHFIRAVLE